MTTTLRVTGGYSDAIIEGLTPYQRIGPIGSPGRDSEWPPTADSARLERYEHFTALIEHRPWDAFPDLKPGIDQDRTIALGVALPELLCNVWPDSVWNDPPDIEFESDVAEGRWGDIWQANGGDTLGWESVFGAAFRGHSILQVYRGEPNAEQPEPIRIKEISPSIYFPVLKPGSAREVQSITLAWEENRASYGEPPDLWQVQENHYLNPSRQYVIEHRERRRGATAWRKGADDEQPEGVDVLPFVELHAARWAGRYWGVSELARVDGLVNEIDARLSEIAGILDYHGGPMLQVPASLMPGGVLAKGFERAFGIRDPAEANIAKYITFDGKVSDQFAQIDKAVEYCFLTSEVPPTYFGFAEGASLSGTALRLRLQNYLKKAGRWQSREDARLRRLADVVLRIDGLAPEDRAIRKIAFGSPLPADDEQEARIEQTLFEAGLSSRETSIRRLRRVDPDNVDEEIAAIERENETTGATPPPSVIPPPPAPGLPGLPPPEPPL